MHFQVGLPVVVGLKNYLLLELPLPCKVKKLMMQSFTTSSTWKNITRHTTEKGPVFNVCTVHWLTTLMLKQAVETTLQITSKKTLSLKSKITIQSPILSCFLDSIDNACQHMSVAPKLYKSGQLQNLQCGPI